MSRKLPDGWMARKEASTPEEDERLLSPLSPPSTGTPQWLIEAARDPEPLEEQAREPLIETPSLAPSSGPTSLAPTPTSTASFNSAINHHNHQYQNGNHNGNLGNLGNGIMDSSPPYRTTVRRPHSASLDDGMGMAPAAAPFHRAVLQRALDRQADLLARALRMVEHKLLATQRAAAGRDRQRAVAFLLGAFMGMLCGMVATLAVFLWLKQR